MATRDFFATGFTYVSEHNRPLENRCLLLAHVPAVALSGGFVIMGGKGLFAIQPVGELFLGGRFAGLPPKLARERLHGARTIIVGSVRRTSIRH